MWTPSSAAYFAPARSLLVKRCARRGGSVTVRLRFIDGRITRDTARTWARSLAREFWGDINSEGSARTRSVAGYAWWFSCTGHGGYILVARCDQVPAWLRKFMVDGAPPWGNPPANDPYAAWAFEEDYDWAAFEAAYPDVARRHNRELAYVVSVLRQWHPALAAQIALSGAPPAESTAP